MKFFFEWSYCSPALYCFKVLCCLGHFFYVPGFTAFYTEDELMRQLAVEEDMYIYDVIYLQVSGMML